MTRRGASRSGPLPTLLEAIGARDSALTMHGESVGRYATIAAQNLGLPPARVRALRLAGILHDIGKTELPAAILDKPGPLTPSEWRAIRNHPEAGHRLLTAAGLEPIAEWVLAHHERPDGTGYPFGLTAAEIPIEASILSAADAYHAMRDDRPYKSPLTHAEAAAELRDCAGTQFDPEVVEALLDGIEAHGLDSVPASEPPAEECPAGMLEPPYAIAGRLQAGLTG